jgi:hypothetical protein
MASITDITERFLLVVVFKMMRIAFQTSSSSSKWNSFNAH